MLYYIITLSTFEWQIHILIKNVNELLKLLLLQKKLKTADYTDVIFITEKSTLYYYRFKDDISHHLLSFYKTLFFSTKSIKQSKQ